MFRDAALALTRCRVLPNFVLKDGGVVVDGITKLVREEGVRAGYKGLGPTVLALLPSWAIYFPVYEHMKQTLASANLPDVSCCTPSSCTRFTLGIDFSIFCD